MDVKILVKAQNAPVCPLISPVDVPRQTPAQNPLVKPGQSLELTIERYPVTCHRSHCAFWSEGLGKCLVKEALETLAEGRERNG